MKHYTIQNKFYFIASILFLIAVWKLLSIFVGNDILIPSPELTLQNVMRIASSNFFWQALINTLLRSAIGFFMAFLLALLLAFISGLLPCFYYLLHPLLSIIKATPTIAFILLALIWLKTEITPILVGFLIIFPIIYFNVLEGIKNVDKDLLEMAQTYRVKKWRIVKEIYFPSLIPYLFAASFTALGLNLKAVIAAEVLSQPEISIGTGLQMEKIQLNTAGVFAWTLIAVLLVVIFDFLLASISKKF